jgi:virulence factor Mce-like protein
MGRRRGGSIAGSPLLIGAVTTLIVIVAVFLSYNANNGLPFVPTYNIKAELPEASGLQNANQVRIAGSRVGLVRSLSLRQDPRTGRVTTIANLKLEKSVEPLPHDTKAIVQSVSAIGLKYLELEKGSSRTPLRADETIPLSQTSEPVDIDQLFNMFDEKTRTASQINLDNFGNGLAGRGLGLNETIHALRPLVTNAVPVLHNLASPATGLREFFIALERASAETAPVAQANAAAWSDQDTFFTAWASVAKSLEEATVGGPASLEQATYSLPFEAPLLEKSAEFMHLLRPSARSLRVVARPLGHAFTVGAVNLKSATSLNSQLASSAQALQSFAQNPVVAAGLEDFAQTLQLGNPFLAGLAPAQAYCNYITLTFRNVASLQAENVGVGSVARAGAVIAPTGLNNEGYPSSAPANGPSIEHVFGSSTIIDNNHVHANPYPSVGAAGQAKVCEAANESYEKGKAVAGNLPVSSVSTNREFTTREQNLFGEKYPAATLAALGVTTPPKPTTTHKKTTTKKKGKRK